MNRKVNRVDVAVWQLEKGKRTGKGKGKGEGKEVLLVATNLNYEGAVVELKALGISGGGSGSGRQVFDSGGKAEGGQLVFESVGSAAWIFR